jgi:hypothetical protein
VEAITVRAERGTVGSWLSQRGLARELQHCVLLLSSLLLSQQTSALGATSITVNQPNRYQCHPRERVGQPIVEIEWTVELGMQKPEDRNLRLVTALVPSSA